MEEDANKSEKDSGPCDLSDPNFISSNVSNLTTLSSYDRKPQWTMFPRTVYDPPSLKVPGPGTYSLPKRKITRGTFAKSSRFHTSSSYRDLPGPGHYEPRDPKYPHNPVGLKHRDRYGTLFEPKPMKKRAKSVADLNSAHGRICNAPHRELFSSTTSFSTKKFAYVGGNTSIARPLLHPTCTPGPGEYCISSDFGTKSISMMARRTNDATCTGADGPKPGPGEYVLPRDFCNNAPKTSLGIGKRETNNSLKYVVSPGPVYSPNYRKILKNSELPRWTMRKRTGDENDAHDRFIRGMEPSPQDYYITQFA